MRRKIANFEFSKNLDKIISRGFPDYFFHSHEFSILGAYKFFRNTHFAIFALYSIIIYHEGGNKEKGFRDTISRILNCEIFPCREISITADGFETPLQE